MQNHQTWKLKGLVLETNEEKCVWSFTKSITFNMQFKPFVKVIMCAGMHILKHMNVLYILMCTEIKAFVINILSV